MIDKLYIPVLNKKIIYLKAELDYIKLFKADTIQQKRTLAQNRINIQQEIINTQKQLCELINTPTLIRNV